MSEPGERQWIVYDTSIGSVATIYEPGKFNEVWAEFVRSMERNGYNEFTIGYWDYTTKQPDWCPVIVDGEFATHKRPGDNMVTIVVTRSVCPCCGK